MKKQYRFFFGVIFLLFALNNPVFSADIKKADELFEKNIFQEAQKEYEKIYQESKNPQIKWKAFYRSCESLAHLYRYGDAAQKLINTQLPGDKSNKIRVLILKAGMLRNYLQQYDYSSRQDLIEEEGKDIFRLTPGEIRAEIKDTYIQLWGLKKDLLAREIKNEGYFLNITDIDLNMYPSLYDYLILRWSDYLLTTEARHFLKDSQAPKAEPLLVKNYKYPVNLNGPPQELAAQLLAAASKQKSVKRTEASERLKIKRLLIPINYNVFKIKDPKAYALGAKDILLIWLDEFTASESRAEAGFQAANILNNNDQAAQAVKICRRIEKDFSRTYFAKRAKSLRLNIELPQIQLAVKNSSSPAKDSFTLTTKNLKKIYFRLYKIDPYRYRDDLQSFHNREFRGWSDLLGSKSSNPDWLKKYISERKPFKKWTHKTDDKGRYKYINKTLSPPRLNTGIYLVLASSDSSFKIGRSLIKTCVFNVSDLMLIGTSGFTLKTLNSYYDNLENNSKKNLSDYGMRFYALNARSGKPLSNASLNVFQTMQYRNYKELSGLLTDEQGILELSLPVDVTPHTSDNNYSFDPLAKYNDSYSYWKSEKYFYYYPENPISIFIETDRPIYRPGDKVQAKTIVTKRQHGGFKASDQKKVKFTAYDPNGKEFFTEELNLSEFASANVAFQIPQGRLLGNYSLSVYFNDGRFNNSRYTYFSVEEYKRPEFEVKLKPAEFPWKFNEPVTIEGEAKYYFGSPVPDAAIKYRIKRQSYIPYCFRYWFANFNPGSGQEIASGDTKTDEEGNFVISFTPTSANTLSNDIPDVSQFIIEVEGRDSGGRTIEANQSYKAAKKAVYFAIEPKKGFFLENETPVIESKRLTVNDTPSQGNSTYEVYSLADAPCKTLSELGFNYYEYWGWMPPLDIQLKDIPNHKLIAKGNLVHNKEGLGIIELSTLKQGAYRLVQRTLDQWQEEVKQEKVFVVAKNTKTKIPLNAVSTLIAQNKEYAVGETAKFIIGSALGSGTYYLELWAGNHLISRQLKDKNHPIQLLEIPVTDQMKGGFTLRWFGVKDSKVYHNQATVSVPWKEKKLKLRLDPFNEVLIPGQKAIWALEVKDKDENPVKAEALVLMYDRSLEYYDASSNSWLDSLYSLRYTSNDAIDSDFAPYVYNLNITEGLLEKMLKAFRQPPRAPRLPQLRTCRTWYKSDYRSRRYQEPGDYELEEGLDYMVLDAAAPISNSQSLNGDKKNKEEAKSIVGQTGESSANEVETRKNFADSAFFKPHLITTDNGKARFEFTAPDQLTSWKIKAFALTKDIKEGTLVKETVTKKDLMIRADIPRFFRERDKGTISAIVHNESDKTLKVRLYIEVKENDQLIHNKINLTNAEKNFDLMPHSLETFNWLIDIPGGITNYKVRVVAQSKDLSDAEERILPILPSRERLIESALVSLSGDQTKELKIDLKADPTRINESMIVQVDPQLALSLLNTIPFLIEYPHECVEQTLNKYVPLSIVNEIYKKYPSIKKAVAKIPKRKSLTPPWEKNDPNRQMTLMETPWMWQSEGRPTSWPIIDMLDPKIVEAQKVTTFEKLKSTQLSNGAFPWWPGGKADPYMTLYVLDGFAQARRYGVEVPRDVIEKALAYVNKELPLRLKPQERNFALVSYASYVVTSFSEDEFAQAKKGHIAAKSWIVFLEKNLHVLTPFGKAYLAYTHLRLGDRERAEEILDMALDGWQEDEIAGVYWTPEKYSWIWYSDSVEKHAFFLRTLGELRPEDEKITGMVQWLLFNRKGNVWKSTKASVAAVYALLGYLDQKGALASDETFKIKWGKENFSQVVKADEWLDAPLRFEKKGFQIKDEDSKAIIEKKGPGIAFASMTWTYSTDQIPEASSPGMLGLDRKFYKRVKENDSYHLKPVRSGGKVSVGDQIEVQLKVNTRSQFEYMHLKDPKAAGFEAETLLSGWKYDLLSFYEEPRDSLTNFFMDWIPHGEYILRYRLRPTKPGIYRIGAATLQSMYSPEMTAHSSGFVIEVEE